MNFIKTRLGISVICAIFIAIISASVPLYMYTTYVKTGPETDMFQASSDLRLKYRTFLENNQVISYNRTNDLSKKISVSSESEEYFFVIENITRGENQNNAGYINFDFYNGEEIKITIELTSYELKKGEEGNAQLICDISDLSEGDISNSVDSKCEEVTEELSIEMNKIDDVTKVIALSSKLNIEEDKTSVAITRAESVMKTYGQLSMIENPFEQLEDELLKISSLSGQEIVREDFAGSVEEGNESGMKDIYFGAVEHYLGGNPENVNAIKEGLDVFFNEVEKLTMTDTNGNDLEVVIIDTVVGRSTQTGFYYSQFLQSESISYLGTVYQPQMWFSNPNGQSEAADGYDVIPFGLQYTILVKRVEQNGVYESNMYFEEIEGLF